MSAKSNATQMKKPFCKVCHDAGKVESEYTSHYVRSLPDRNGNTMVTCPTLLSTECRYCCNYGHTAKFCPIIVANKNKNQYQIQKQSYKKREMPKNAAAAKPVSGFAVLAESDSEDEEYPTLGEKVEAKQVITGWAEMAAKPEVMIYKEEDPFENYTVFTPTTKIAPKARTSWADAEDSDDDE